MVLRSRKITPTSKRRGQKFYCTKRYEDARKTLAAEKTLQNFIRNKKYQFSRPLQKKFPKAFKSKTASKIKKIKYKQIKRTCNAWAPEEDEFLKMLKNTQSTKAISPDPITVLFLHTRNPFE